MGYSNYKHLKDYSKLFGGLEIEELKDIAEIITTRNYKADTIIIEEGESGDEMYLLDEGAVDVSKTLTVITSKHEFGTKERSFIRLLAEYHIFFGEMSLFGSSERSATVKAVTDCKLLVINGNDLLELCKHNPKIGFEIVSNICLILADRLRNTNNDVTKLTTALSLALSE